MNIKVTIKSILRLRSMLLGFFMTLAFLAFICDDIKAANITVNTAVDEVNGNTTSIANLIATPGGAGISLREAIIAANNTAGSDVILFAAALNGTPITLTRIGDDASCQNGDLDINDNLTITGNGSANTIIQGATNAAFAGSIGDKVIGINQDGTHLGLTVSISDVTIRYGRNANVPSASFSHTGGGVDVFLTGVGNSTTFTNCIITGNENVFGWGGGVNVDSGTSGLPGDIAINTNNRGTVTFTNCSITNNKTDNYASGSLEGAGLNLYSDIHNVVITNCTITGNQSLDDSGNGGGINIRHSYGGTVTISGGTVSNNTTTGIAGGVCIEGNQNVTMSNVLVDGNSSTNPTARAGGLSVTCLGAAGVTAVINLNNVTISNNHADTGASEGGGIYFNSAYAATFTNCSITGNTAKTGAGVQNAGSTAALVLGISGGSITNNIAATNGGGVSHIGTPSNTTITNCNITGNTAIGNGGGVYVINGTVNLDGLTLSNNTADSDNNGMGDGGGIYHNGGTLNLNNTITVGSSGNGNTAANGGGIANISGNLSKTTGLLTVANNNARNNGGGYYITGGTINLQKTIIINNTANSDNSGGGEGGGIYNNGGALTLNFNRIALNTANANASSNAMRFVAGTITNIQNNWWGTNSPATVINGTASFTPYLQLLHTPGSNAICPNTSTGLTASFVNNSANTNVLANIDRLIGLPIVFNNATPAGSSITSAQSTIQANGTATATFNAGNTPGAGGANATVDNFASNAAITVLAPPMITTLDPVNQSICTSDPVTFTSFATGNPTPTVQWQESVNAGMSFSNIVGATNTTLTFNVIPANNTNQYRAIYTNICGVDTTNAAILTVYPVEHPEFAYAKNAYCQVGTEDPLPVIYGTSGGIFSATAGLSINTTTGQIDVSASSIGGPYTITYNTNGPCPKTATFPVSIVNCIPGATLTDAITIDNGTPALADPNDRIKLTATITNAQAADYNGMQLILNDDPRVTLVAGSFKSTPVAVNDLYATTLNTMLTVPVGAGVMQNDFDDNIPGLSVTAHTNPTQGTLVINANGSFTYNPNNGFTGNDTFTYTITDSDMQTNSGTVKIHVQ